MSKTSISAGLLIYEALMSDEVIASLVTRVFPVVADTAELPYIVYRRASGEMHKHKSGVTARSVNTLEVFCYAASYTDGVALAEAVRGALDGVKITDGDITLDSHLEDSSEDYTADAFVQQLYFTISI